MSENKLPFIEDLEFKLFTVFLQDRKLWVSVYEHIQPEYFSSGDVIKIYKIFKAYFEKYKEFPTYDIVRNICFKKEYNEDVFDMVDQIYNNVGKISDSEIAYIQEECGKFIHHQKIKASLLESIPLLEAGKYESIIDKIKPAILWNNDISFGTEITQVVDRLEKLETLTANVMASPWNALNAALGGGFYAKEITMFFSGSSVGKSIALDNVGSYFFQHLKKNVLQISLELSEERKCQRIDAAMFDIPASEVLKNKSKIINYYNNTKFDNKFIIKEFSTRKASTKHIRNFMYQLELYHGFRPDALIVDYLDIMVPDEKQNNTYEDQGSISEDLRAIAQEMEIPVITATQANKTVTNINIADMNETMLAESFRKMMAADSVIGMAITPEERMKGIIQMKTIKSRSGQKDLIFPLRVDYPKLKISNL